MFIYPGDSLIDLSTPAYGVLSQNSLQHLQDLPPTDPSAFNQAADHPHMLQHRLGPPAGIADRSLRQIGWAHRRPTLAILNALFDLALLPAVILDTPSARLLLAMGFLAPKGTSQVTTAGIARMGEEENAAMPAPG